MSDWLRFALTAALLAAALGFLTAGVVGNCRFRYVMNRLHAAGLGDTMGLLLASLALAVSAPDVSGGLRLFLPPVFLWITSPVSTHFVALIEYFKEPRLYEHVKRR